MANDKSFTIERSYPLVSECDLWSMLWCDANNVQVISSRFAAFHSTMCSGMANKFTRLSAVQLWRRSEINMQKTTLHWLMALVSHKFIVKCHFHESKVFFRCVCCCCSRSASFLSSQLSVCCVCGWIMLMLMHVPVTQLHFRIKSF